MVEVRLASSEIGDDLDGRVGQLCGQLGPTGGWRGVAGAGEAVFEIGECAVDGGDESFNRLVDAGVEDGEVSEVEEAFDAVGTRAMFAMIEICSPRRFHASPYDASLRRCRLATTVLKVWAADVGPDVGSGSGSTTVRAWASRSKRTVPPPLRRSRRQAANPVMIAFSQSAVRWAPVDERRSGFALIQVRHVASHHVSGEQGWCVRVRLSAAGTAQNAVDSWFTTACDGEPLAHPFGTSVRGRITGKPSTCWSR